MFLRRVALYPLFTALLLAAAIGCISRDNYWDPVNYTVIFQRNLRDSTLANIDSGYRLLGLDSLAAIEQRLLALSAANARLLDDNSGIVAENQNTRQNNDLVHIANDSLQPPAVFELKKFLDSIFHLLLPDSLPSLQPFRDAVPLEKVRVDALLTDANSRGGQPLLFSLREYDSILARYDAALRLVDTIEARRTLLRTTAVATNADPVVPYNDAVRAENIRINQYNDSMARYLTIKVIPNNADSIITLLHDAQPGDKFLLANDQVDIRTLLFANSGTATQPIVIMGQENTKFNLADVVLDNNSWFTFSSIEFSASAAQCVLVQNGCTGIVFNRCQFSSSAIGLTITSSNVTLNDCIVKNGTEGMLVSSSPGESPTVMLNNVLIVGTTGNGIHVTGTNLVVQNASIIRNGGEAIYLVPPALPLVVRNTLIANTGGTANPAIYFEGGYTDTLPLTITNLNMVQNGAEQDTVNAPVTEPILHYDPMFINEYDISPQSPLDSLEKAGVVIGFRRN